MFHWKYTPVFRMLMGIAVFVNISARINGHGPVLTILTCTSSGFKQVPVTRHLARSRRDNDPLGRSKKNERFLNDRFCCMLR